MRISDWSSDVCSSDLHEKYGIGRIEKERHIGEQALDGGITPCRDERDEQHERERASEFGQSEHGLTNGARGGGEDRQDQHQREQICDLIDRPTPAEEMTAEGAIVAASGVDRERSDEHRSELHSLMRISYAVFCLKQ